MPSNVCTKVHNLAEHVQKGTPEKEQLNSHVRGEPLVQIFIHFLILYQQLF